MYCFKSLRGQQYFGGRRTWDSLSSASTCSRRCFSPSGSDADGTVVEGVGISVSITSLPWYLSRRVSLSSKDFGLFGIGSASGVGSSSTATGCVSTWSMMFDLMIGGGTTGPSNGPGMQGVRNYYLLLVSRSNILKIAMKLFYRKQFGPVGPWSFVFLGCVKLFDELPICLLLRLNPGRLEKPKDNQ